jgi:hypothetical protein
MLEFRNVPMTSHHVTGTDESTRRLPVIDQVDDVTINKLLAEFA